MPRIKSDIERSIGKLISVIQKEWGEELGTESADATEDILGLAHEILQASKKKELDSLLKHQTVLDYLGAEWVDNHPTVKSAISVVERLRSS